MSSPHPAWEANREGMQHYQAGRLREAIAAYQQAIDLQPDYLDAYVNLGLALKNAHRLEEARHVYQALLELHPMHVAALFHLGCIEMMASHFERASQYFLQVLAIDPVHSESLVNVASCYLQQHRYQEAKVYYLKAYALAPDDKQVLFNLGVMSAAERRFADARAYYQAAIEVDIVFFEAHYNLALVYEAEQKTALALRHLRAALQCKPNDADTLHRLAILTQQTPVTTPQTTIQALFDAYADHYDTHLTQQLAYQVPKCLYDLFIKHSQKTQSLAILDVGVGTGLLGQWFRSHAARLVGVDLSEAMLARAEAKQCYDTLVQSELIAYLQTCTEPFDVILAADVIVYLGQLRPFFVGASSVLRAGGLLLFSVEPSVDLPYHLQASGRFAHHEGYIRQSLVDLPLQIEEVVSATLRTQAGKAVAGCFYVIRRLG